MLSSAFGSDKPDLKLSKVTKNKAIQGQIDEAIKGSKDTFALSDENIANFMRTFGENQPRFQAQTEQDIGQLDRIYGGGMEADLFGMRQRASGARSDATDRALRMIEGRDRQYAASLGMPGRSSYRDLMGARLSRDTLVDAALADAAQERADYGYLSGQKLGNLGRRQMMLQAGEGREFMPLQAVSAARGMPLQNLGSLANLDQLNNFYGTYRKRGTLERLANAEQTGMDQLGQITSMVGDVAGVVGAFCWIAREVFGNNDPRWKIFRTWMLAFSPMPFMLLYVRHGAQFAGWLRVHPEHKPMIRRWMESKIGWLMNTI